jgi:hypothetical protein
MTIGNTIPGLQDFNLYLSVPFRRDLNRYLLAFGVSGFWGLNKLVRLHYFLVVEFGKNDH